MPGRPGDSPRPSNQQRIRVGFHTGYLGMVGALDASAGLSGYGVTLDWERDSNPRRPLDPYTLSRVGDSPVPLGVHIPKTAANRKAATASAALDAAPD